MTFRVLAFMLLLSVPASAAPSHAAGCMSLMAPDVLFCTDDRGRTRICDVASDVPRCRSLQAVYRDWTLHPERRAEFYKRLYGAQ